MQFLLVANNIYLRGIHMHLKVKFLSELLNTSIPIYGQMCEQMSLFLFSHYLFHLIKGEAPVDPTVGFLPPNNGTTGQGFVTFTVRAKQQLGTLPVIDAKASIIFDQNEPIDTPPIFNTVSVNPNIPSIGCKILTPLIRSCLISSCLYFTLFL